MFDTYMYISFVFMAIIFLRQISIYKQPNKISYAPLMLAIGAIASLIHFIISNEQQSLFYTLKGSSIPFLIALMLYIIMNIMHQTQKNENERIQKETTLSLIEHISQLQEFSYELKDQMQSYAKEEQKLKEEFSIKLSEDIKTLAQLLENQKHLMNSFKELYSWSQQLQELFINFTEFKLPELDSVIHKHIEMLRITNKEQFDTIKVSLDAVQNIKEDMQDEFRFLQEKIESIKYIADTITSQIVHNTTDELNQATKRVQEEFLTLLREAERLKTELLTSETKLEAIKTQSEFVIRQMVVIAKKMESFEEERELLAKSIVKLLPLLRQIESKEEKYEDLLEEIEKISTSITSFEKHFRDEIKENLASLPDRIEQHFEKLQEQLNSKNSSVSESIELLAKQAKLHQMGYDTSNLDKDNV
ncbi:similar to Golgin subfamily A member 2 (Cis-Golgi matrix protein GM130) [hydrothermal vent metagenome]|uniref:Similar to Golgin subfamily A member 2 (Cis-Golgi matrix protein GM130) n=1 Tax=hydrothermal vent metagenome TaxID=652676 RepID=A0A1W1B942_9ZZZZ